MTDITEQARAAVDAFQDAFNAQDHERLAAALNYPHVRLWSGVFTTIETPEEFAEISRRGQSRLEAEGWDHTDTVSMEVVQQGADKAHCALVNHRCRADGAVYHQFDTLWIVTNQDGHGASNSAPATSGLPRTSQLAGPHLILHRALPTETRPGRSLPSVAMLPGAPRAIIDRATSWALRKE